MAIKGIIKSAGVSTGKSFFKVFGVLAVSALVLSACRAEEQGRIIQYEPGVYLGKPDPVMSADLLRRLSLRVGKQGDSLYRAGGGGSAKKSDVRKPAPSTRTGKQGNP